MAMKLPMHIHLIHLTPAKDLGFDVASQSKMTIQEGVEALDAIAERAIHAGSIEVERFIKLSGIKIPKLDPDNAEALKSGCKRLMDEVIGVLMDKMKVCAWVSHELVFIITCENVRVTDGNILSLIESTDQEVA